MRNPFHYQKTKHVRTEKPPVFSTYRPYKPFLRTEFAGQCVYCRAVDRMKGSESFGVDHYRPKIRFPRFATDYENLFYACNRCNSLKRDFWPSPRQKKDQVFIPNPCDYAMFDHLRYLRGTVQPHSAAGIFSEEALDLNDPECVEFREGVITVLAATSSKIEETRVLLKEATLVRDQALNPKDQVAAQQVVDQINENLVELEGALTKILGPA